MKTIYFIRHGESGQNAGNTYQGDVDPLTEKGRAQAQYMARRCAKLPLQALLASTMTRAQDTAKEIAEVTGLAVESSDLLVERKDPSALINVEWGAEQEKMFNEWTDTFFVPDARVSDGENFADLYTRAAKALQSLKNREESHIAVVTHGFFLRMVMAQVVMGQALTPEVFRNFHLGFRSNNTGITLIQTPSHDDIWAHWMEGRDWIVRVWNDRAHLG